METAEEGLVVVEHQLPRGGPIYLADVVGPLTRIPDFETSIVDELQSLISQLDDHHMDEEDILVDDLKVFSEEELVEIALKQALQVENPNLSHQQETTTDVPNSSQVLLPSHCDQEHILEKENNTDLPDSSQDLVPNFNNNGEDIVENTLLEENPPSKQSQEQEERMTYVPNSSQVHHTEEDIVENGLQEVAIHLGNGNPNIDLPGSLPNCNAEDMVENVFQEEEQPKTLDLVPTHNGENIVENALLEPIQVEHPSNKVQEEPSITVPDSSHKLKSNSKKSKKRRRTLKKNSNKTTRKRGRKFDRDTRSAILDNPHFVEKVEKLAEIKCKQDEDKRAAKLHSFNGSVCKVREVSISKADNVGKMTSLRYTTTSGVKVKMSADEGEHVRISYPEVVLCVEVYHSRKKWTKTQELLVLGSQMLSELRDRLYCSTDQLMQKAGQSDPSCYFLIEDIFCNDKRDPLAVDYSEPIFDWLRNSKEEVQEKWECILSGELQQKQRILFGQAPTPHLPNFKAVDMHKVRFCDLWFRLGAGYLYCHQGDCKHTIVVRDMRLIHPEDIQNRAAYPIVTFQLKNVLPKCSVCKIYRATKVTVDDKWAKENPCYFCDNCYYLLHYDENGSLLYPDFAVYDYHHM